MAPRNGAHVKRKTVVVKVGTASVTKEKSPNAYVELDLDTINSIAEGIAELHAQGYGVVLVSSGAVAAGMAKCKVKVRERKKIARENDLLSLRHYAEIGQPILFQRYSEALEGHGIMLAQSLTERNAYHDMEHRKDIRDLRKLDLKRGIVVHVNGNDATTKAELHIGDNDFTAVHEAVLIGAGHLVFLTDMPGILLPDPRNPEGERKLQEVIDFVSPELISNLGQGSRLGTGGPGTKIVLCDLARRSGINPVIAGKDEAKRLVDLVEGRADGTRFPIIGKTSLTPEIACDVLDQIAKHGTALNIDDYFHDLSSIALDRMAAREAKSAVR